MELFSIEQGEQIWRLPLHAHMSTVNLFGSAEQRYMETECTVENFGEHVANSEIVYTISPISHRKMCERCVFS